MRILLSGGGTGGHVYPILAVVSALRQGQIARLAGSPNQAPDCQPPPGLELRYLGEAGGIEEQLAARHHIPFSAVRTGQIRGRAPWIVARNAIRMAGGVRQCQTVIRDFRPDVVFMTGGYVAAPVAWATWQESRRGRRIPLLIYLPDLTPGMAIRLSSRLAHRVAVSFAEVSRFFPGKAVVTGYPVRPELLSIRRDSGRAALGLEQNLPVLLVFGGSRGARSINRALVDALPELLLHCSVVHISGQLDWSWVANAGGELPADLQTRYHAFAYLDEEMMQALAAADLVVARAGASTLGEFPAVGLPSILVPYPYAGQHQEANAAYLAERGAALVLPDGDLGQRLAPTVLELLQNRLRLAQMARAASSLACPQAAVNIALQIQELAGC